jgi:malonyl-CoA O-methyltransferase
MDEPFQLQKSLVRTHFERAAARYDSAAFVQCEAGERMFERLDLLKITPKRILDLGAGTGIFAEKLRQRYPHASVIELDLALSMLQKSKQRISSWKKWLFPHKQQSVCADMESLPFANQSIDFIWSNFALQWCDTPDAVFAECQRVLAPGGVMVFCTLGPDTLKELRWAFLGIDSHLHVNRFLDMHDIGDALMKQRLSAPVMDMEYITIAYSDVKTLLSDLKTIGANNGLQGRRTGLMGKTAWRQMLENYETLREAGELPATYEIIYGHAWKNKEMPSAAPLTFYPKKP